MVSPKLKMYADKAPYVVLIDSEPPRVEDSGMQVAPAKKKKPGTRSWMRFDSSGMSEFLELDRSAIMQRASIPARDLRILGPIFSQSSHILARERAMVVNLEFIKAIVTAEEVYLLDALSPAVLPFVEQLKEQFSSGVVSEGFVDGPKKPMVQVNMPEASLPGALVEWHAQGNNIMDEEIPDQLPFEFRVLEIALDVVCNYLEGRVIDLELKAYPTLDEFSRNITSSNLELVRTLKSALTRLTARVQKVRDELEQLLDHDDDMADLYLSRKHAQLQHEYSPSISLREDGAGAFRTFESHKISNSNEATSMILAASLSFGNEGVEELEMLLEAYFMQLDGTLNKLTMIREYIDDTEDYINIQLDRQRNQLFQFQITLTTAALAVALSTAMCGAVSMNLKIYLYRTNDSFVPVILGALTVSLLVFSSVLGYVHWKGLFEK